MRGRLLRVAEVLGEELLEGDTVTDPGSFVSELSRMKMNADLFTFAERLPGSALRFDYPMEHYNVAALPIISFSHWWEERTEYSVRKAVNRARKLGVVTKVVPFEDDLAEGIRRMYGETPVRQGKSFWHYGKGLDLVKHELGTYLDRSVFIGAYLQDELIGSMKLTFVGPTAVVMQFLSVQRHFDKRPNNALIAEAVKVCEQTGKSHLIYGSFVYYDDRSSLTEFKRRNGFEAVLLPRYYIPLTFRGRIGLAAGLHRELAAQIPEPVFRCFLKVRSAWSKHSTGRRSPTEERPNRIRQTGRSTSPAGSHRLEED